MLKAIGFPELIVIGIVFTLLFGGPKIASLGKGVGEALREFKKAHREAEEAKQEIKL